MAIEPLSSMMTIQAQPLQDISSVSTGAKSGSAAEYTESTVTAAPLVDENTMAVSKSNETDADGGNDAGQGRAQNPNINFDMKEATEKTNEKIKQAVDELNKKMYNSEALFGIHEATNRVTIKIVDKSTKEVIKELPPEKTLDMIAKAWEMAGLMVDERR